MSIGNTPLGNMAIRVDLDDTRLNQTANNMKALMKSVNAEFIASMSAVKRTGSEMDILATRTEGLNKKFEVQKRTVQSLEDEYKKLADIANDPKATQQQIRAAESKRTALNREKASLNDLEGALQQAQKEQDEMMANNKRLESSFGKLDSSIKKTGDKLKGIGGNLSGVGRDMSMTLTAPLIGAGALAVKTAGEYEAASAQFKTVFGDLEGQADETLNSIADKTGLLPNSLKGTYTQIAAFAKTGGASTAEAMDLTARATMAAADSSAFLDRNINEVTESLQSYLKGNFENDAALGISSTETTRNAKANELYSKSFNDLNESQKQLTLLAMVEDGNKLSGALGQAARESDTLATQTSNVKTAFKDFLAEVGKPLLPIAVNLLKSMAGVGKELADRFSNMSSFGQQLMLGLGALIAVLPPILIGIGLMASGLGSIMALGAPLSLTVLAVVGGLALLATGLTLAYKKSETFRNIVNGAFNGVANTAKKVIGTIKGVFQLFKGDGTQGVITLSKFLPPNLVVGITKTVDTIKATFKSMATAVSNAFKSIGDYLAKFWKENGTMIIQALKNIMIVVTPILKALGVIFKVAFVAIKLIVSEVFKSVVGVIKGALKIITGIIKVFAGLFTGNWKKMFSGIWDITKGLIQVIWNGINLMFFGKIIKGGLIFAKGFAKIFPTLLNGIKKLFTRIFNDIVKFVTSTWKNLDSKTVSALNGVRKFIGSSLGKIKDTFTSIFKSIWNKVKDTFDNIREYMPKMITRAKDGVTSGLGKMRDNLFDLTKKMKNRVKDMFDDMVDGAKALPRKLGDGIRNGASKAVDGVRSLGNRMVGKLGGVVNTTIGGVNTVTGKLGIDKKIKEWKVPKFSTGTMNGALAQDSLITVGDKGVGNWKGTRELVQHPDGKMQLFNKETTFHAKAGTKVFSNYETEHLLNTLKFSKGTGAGGFWGDLGKSVIGGIGKLDDWLDKPKSYVKNMIGSVLKKTGFKGLSGFAKNMAKGSFNVVTDGVKSFISDIFKKESSEGATGKAGILDPNMINYHYGHTSAYKAITGRDFHEGIDFPFVYQKVKTPMAGILKRMPFMANGYGNWVKVINGATELIFGHLRDFGDSPASGTRVKAGDVIGRSGNTGFSTGAHLHFTRLVNGRYTDPEAWLRSLKGFRTGGLAFGKQLAWLDEDNHGEAIIPFDPARRVDAMKLLAYTAQKIMPKEKGGKGYRPSSIPNVNTNSNQGNNDLITMMMTMIKNQEKQIKLQQQQIDAIQEDRYTTVEADGRKIAEVTHEHHKAIDKRKQQFRPSLT